MWWGKVTLFLSAKRATWSWISLWSWQPKDVGVSLLLTTIIASLVHSQMEISGDHWTPTVRTYFIFKWARCAIGIHTLVLNQSINLVVCHSWSYFGNFLGIALGFVNVDVHRQHGKIVQFLVTMYSVDSEHVIQVSLDPNAMNIKFPLYLVSSLLQGATVSKCECHGRGSDAEDGGATIACNILACHWFWQGSNWFNHTSWSC